MKGRPSDLSQALNECFRPNLALEFKAEEEPRTITNTNGLPPIILVHGIFGFGKGVRHHNDDLFRPVLCFDEMGFHCFDANDRIFLLLLLMRFLGICFVLQ